MLLRRGPKFQHHSSRVQKSVDFLILSNINTLKSNPKAQMDVSDELGDFFVLEKSPSVDERVKLSDLPSLMSARTYTMQCTTLYKK